MPDQNIKLSTVGIVEAGKYAGWYIFVRPHEPSEEDSAYTVYICTDTTFMFNPAERECYDNWAENMSSLEHMFEGYLDVKAVRWDENITPPQFGPPHPVMQRIAERLREHMNKRNAEKDMLAGTPSDDSGKAAPE